MALKKKAPRPGADRMDLSRTVGRGGKIIEETAAESKKRTAHAATLTVILFSLGFSIIYSLYYVEVTALVTVFDGSLNKLLFGPGYGVLMGDPVIDRALTIAIRTVFFMAIFGIIPWLSYSYARSRTNNPYLLVWSMTSFVAFVIVLTHKILWPFANDIMAQFSF